LSAEELSLRVFLSSFLADTGALSATFSAELSLGVFLSTSFLADAGASPVVTFSLDGRFPPGLSSLGGVFPFLSSSAEELSLGVSLSSFLADAGALLESLSAEELSLRVFLSSFLADTGALSATFSAELSLGVFLSTSFLADAGASPVVTFSLDGRFPPGLSSLGVFPVSFLAGAGALPVITFSLDGPFTTGFSLVLFPLSLLPGAGTSLVSLFVFRHFPFGLPFLP